MGCSFLGCGGGGFLAEGRARLADDLTKGLRFELLGVADLGDDEWVASPYGLGSNAPPPAWTSPPSMRSDRAGRPGGHPGLGPGGGLSGRPLQSAQAPSVLGSPGQTLEGLPCLHERVVFRNLNEWRLP